LTFLWFLLTYPEDSHWQIYLGIAGYPYYHITEKKLLLSDCLRAGKLTVNLHRTTVQINDSLATTLQWLEEGGNFKNFEKWPGAFPLLSSSA